MSAMSRALEPGAVVGGDFRIVRCLRAGGMGSVYLAEQLSTGAQRAVKVMRPELVDDDSTRKRFLLEARVGARIESDHVVEVVTAGIDPESGAPFLVMELLKGEELAELVDRVGPLPIADVAEILAQAGHALSRAHALGIVHRDLKPENLFIANARRRDAPFTVKILDFGIAKLMEDQPRRATQALGTPLYMAPEQADRGGRITPRSDVWALGLVAFFMLTGHDFWRNAAAGLSAILKEILTDPIPRASKRTRELAVDGVLPSRFDEWFALCVARDPARRFPDAGAAVGAFAAIVPAELASGLIAKRFRSSGEPSDPASAPTQFAPDASTHEPASVTPPAMRRSRWTGAALGSVLVVGLAIWVGSLRRAAPRPQATAPAPAAPQAAHSSGPAIRSCPTGMVLIQGGAMFMGEKGGIENARPAHKVELSSFCLDVTETTAAAYDHCVGSGNCLKPPRDVYFPGITRDERGVLAALCNSRRPGHELHPINCVDWSMANNFCRTHGGRLAQGGARLPTEAEWEYAARGSSQRAYPWGDDPPGPTRVNACGTECVAWMKEKLGRATPDMFDAGDGYTATAPVGSFPAGASRDGVMDLAGNVWEWTADWYAPYTAAEARDPHGPASGTERVVRGGAYNGSEADWLEPAYRWKTAPGAYNPAIGFRCAATPHSGGA